MNIHLNSQQLIQNAIDAYQLLDQSLKACSEQGIDRLEVFDRHFYEPHEILTELLLEFKNFLESQYSSPEEKQNAGYLLEKIAILSFGSLKGYNNLKAYQSMSAQYDLLISGNSPEWESLFSILRIDDLPKGILLEAKATNGKINDSQFSRLCSLIDHNFSKSVGLGIFFSINSLSGLPEEREQRLRKASDGYLKQIIFYCKTKIPIIVLDKEDILQLDKPGSLIKILDRKIRELEEMTGTKIEPIQSKVIDIPPKFNDVLKWLE
ncbi:hypothetical protein AWQ21_04555 [Picosynechococcus sp. PCC 7003]|uniref:hypothetical protein n=1 Tax=Picosynechococcus sp. PCC 7003 TaxID=374981 RepID=UPI000810BAA0|nr:hypothetical protein [Picosynechococcus sp. PCC 7003]ANV83714.1 hypothetical protein AWQ21_04555 [Picosynechococcus sp. PCC 7003]